MALSGYGFQGQKPVARVGFGVWGLGFGGFSGFRGYGVSGFRGLGFRVMGLGFRPYRKYPKSVRTPNALDAKPSICPAGP